MSIWEQLTPYLAEDLTGWSVLDIGCGTGERALEAARRGAVVRGIDTDTEAVGQARQAASAAGLDMRAEFDTGMLYDLASEWDRYDLVLCEAILPHLRYPTLALDIVAQKTKRLLVFAAPGLSDADALFQKSGLHVSARLTNDLFLCEPDAGARAAWDAEHAAAVGQAARLTKTLTFQHCWVHCAPGYTETCYHDGTLVTATPEDSDAYRAMAAEFGYGGDTAALSREHEILHTFLGEKLGSGSSPTLWAVAHGQTEDVAAIWEQEEEEVWTLSFQAYLRSGKKTAGLARLSDFGLSLEALALEARRLLR